MVDTQPNVDWVGGSGEWVEWVFLLCIRSAGVESLHKELAARAPSGRGQSGAAFLSCYSGLGLVLCDRHTAAPFSSTNRLSRPGRGGVLVGDGQGRLQPSVGRV